MDKLIDWKSRLDNKPLIIRGARQVGKSTLIHEFGKVYKYYISLNLEKSKDQTFFTDYGDEVNTSVSSSSPGISVHSG